MSTLLGILPAILLVLLLALGYYPGEEIIGRIGRRPAPGQTRPKPVAPSWLSDAVRIRERLLLLAASRPLRGPPFLS